jgi:hypothetical protein
LKPILLKLSNYIGRSKNIFDPDVIGTLQSSSNLAYILENENKPVGDTPSISLTLIIPFTVL